MGVSPPYYGPKVMVRSARVVWSKFCWGCRYICYHTCFSPSCFCCSPVSTAVIVAGTVVTTATAAIGNASAALALVITATACLYIYI